MSVVKLSWDNFKIVIDSKSLACQYFEKGDYYYIIAFDGQLNIECILHKDNSTEHLDFENNYKDNCNDQIGNPSYDQQGNLKVSGEFSSGEITLDPTKAKVEFSDTNVDLNRSTESYNTIYSYSGSGTFYGFWMDFNSDRILTKLTIDGNVIFDVDCDAVEAITPSSGDDDGNSGSGSTGWLSWNKSSNCLNFRPVYGIKYASEVKIEAKANSNTTSRDMDGYFIDITKD